jgi:uncharacterized protein YaaQ
MKLVVSIVHSDDAGQLVESLTQAGYGATIISTTGGFLRQGNSTVFVGTDDQKVPDVLKLVQASCQKRRHLINPLPPVMEPGEMYMPTPVDVEVGGATVFVLEVTQSEQF